MTDRIVLASGSEVRQSLLRNAGVSFDVTIARVDEESLRSSLVAEQASPRDIADALAQAKALRVAQKAPDALVIGCDQILEFNGEIMGKPETSDAARSQLTALRGNRHRLLSAAVICDAGRPVWRTVGEATLEMRDFSDDYLDDYLARNWASLRQSVGGYKIEEEGIRLFSVIRGDYFHILGFPLIEVLSYLTLRGSLPK